MQQLPAPNCHLPDYNAHIHILIVGRDKQLIVVYPAAMKKLTLLRHAKSSWNNDVRSDFDRPLNKRGRATAPLIGAELIKRAGLPDYILCSSAMRTRETLDLLFKADSQDTEILYEQELYLSSPKVMFKHVKNAGSKFDHILVIAHNPGTQLLALDLAKGSTASEAAIVQMQNKYPTCGMAHFEFDIRRWSEAANGSGILKFFVRPKNLA